jgi:hypothetical protein
MSADLDPLRGEVAARHGLGVDARSFLTGTTVDELEAQAAALAKVLGAHADRREPEPAAAPDLLTVAAAEKARRKQELAAMFCGRAPQPRAESGRFASFDGGARQALPVPKSPERAHGELVAGLASYRRTHGGGGASF